MPIQYLQHQVVLVLLFLIAHVADASAAGSQRGCVRLGVELAKIEGKTYCKTSAAVKSYAPAAPTAAHHSHQGCCTGTPATPSGSCCMRASQASCCRFSSSLCSRRTGPSNQKKEQQRSSAAEERLARTPLAVKAHQGWDLGVLALRPAAVAVTAAGVGQRLDRALHPRVAQPKQLLPCSSGESTAAESQERSGIAGAQIPRSTVSTVSALQHSLLRLPPSLTRHPEQARAGSRVLGKQPMPGFGGGGGLHWRPPLRRHPAARHGRGAEWV